jgi:hypothetical protein
MRGLADIGKILVAAVLMAVLGFNYSCTKNEKIDLNPGLNVANDIIIAQRPVLLAFRLLIRAVNDTALQQTHHGAFDGASVTYNPGQNRYSFYFFGICPDGVARAGRIDADLFGELQAPGTGARFTFYNYFEDGMNMNAGDTLVNTGLSGDNLTFTNSVTGGVILKDTIGTIRFSATLNYQVPAAPWNGPASAMIGIVGSISGTSSKGFVFSSDVPEPIIYQVFSETCAWVRQGTIRFYISDTASAAGTIRLPGVSSCNDSVYYDLSGTTYRWRMKFNYLNH